MRALLMLGVLGLSVPLNGIQPKSDRICGSWDLGFEIDLKGTIPCSRKLGNRPAKILRRSIGGIDDTIFGFKPPGR